MVAVWSVNKFRLLANTAHAVELYPAVSWCWSTIIKQRANLLLLMKSVICIVQYAPPIFQHTATVWQAILALSLLPTLWMK